MPLSANALQPHPWKPHQRCPWYLKIHIDGKVPMANDIIYNSTYAEVGKEKVDTEPAILLGKSRLIQTAPLPSFDSHDPATIWILTYSQTARKKSAPLPKSPLLGRVSKSVNNIDHGMADMAVVLHLSPAS